MVGGAGQQRKRAGKTSGRGARLERRSQMPFARHEGEVTRIGQQLGQGRHAVIEEAFVTRFATLAFGQHLLMGAEPGDMRIGAGEQHGACRSAGGGGVEIREAQARRGQRVEMGGGDLAAECPDVGKAQIVGDDHQKIGPLIRHRPLCRFLIVFPRSR